MAEKKASYLSRLKFDPKLWNTIQAKYLVNIRLVLLLIISIVAIGLVAYQNIPRRLNPEVDIPIVVVNTVLPGASPNDIESLVTVPIEDKLRGMEGLDTLTSTSTENVSTITLQFLSNVNSDEAKNDVQSLVDTVNDLPEDTQDPAVIKVDFENQPVLNFVVTTTKDFASLMRFSETLEERIDDLPKVDRVDTSGFDQQEVQVVLDQAKIAELNVNPLLLSQSISRAMASYPAGNINTNQSVISLSIDPDVTTLDDIRNIRINQSDKVITLADIAQVSEVSKLAQGRTYYADGQRKGAYAVQFFVYKTPSANIDDAGEEVHKVLEEVFNENEKNFKLITISDTSEDIAEQFTDLLGEFSTTIVLVFINLLLFLGLRQALISSLTIPLTFLSAVAIINLLGLSLNFLTLFAFLIALGLLIDDTIVTVAAVTRYYSTGKFTPAEAGLLVWKDFIVPLWSTTITTIWAFVPLLLATGIIGEFIKPIPIVVTSVMLSSTAIAVLITLPLMMVILKPQIPHRVSVLLKVLGVVALLGAIYFFLPKNPLFPFTLLVMISIILALYRTKDTLWNLAYSRMSKLKYYRPLVTRTQSIIDKGVINTEGMSVRYMRLIDRILSSRAARIRTVAVIVIFALVAYLLIPLGFVKNEFFPSADAEILYVSVDLPAGTNLQTTQIETVRMLDELRHTEAARFIIAETGTSLGGEFNRSNSPNSFTLTLQLGPLDERNITSMDLAQKLRDKYQNYTRGKLAVRELSGGPPAGADLQIQLLGEDLNQLDQYANKVTAFLEKEPGVTNVDKSVKSGTSKLVFVPDKNKLAENNITVDTLGLWLRTFASGFTLDQIKLDAEETDIVFRMSNNVLSPEDIGALSIPTQTGAVPLLSLGKLSLETNPTLITREDGKRSIAVSAGITEDYSVTDKNAELEEFADSLNLPQGYSWKTGGVNEENEKSVQSIFQAMGLSFLLILITMIIEFGSYRQALLVMLTIPLAIPGVFYIFALTGTPLSFPALIGVLALFGIVVTNAIVVVEKINDNRKEGMNLHDSVVDAAGSRLEPILLTSLTSILGLLPITLSDPLWRGLGGAIISGLFFSGIVKLFFIPIVYFMWYGGGKEDRKVK